MVFAVERSIGLVPALIVIGIVVAMHTWGGFVAQCRERSRMRRREGGAPES